MNITDVSKEITTVLTPMLPVLTSIGTKAVEEVGKGLGSGALEKARIIWAKLSGVGKSDSALADTAAKVAATPSDERLQVRLSCEIEKALERDGALLKECIGFLADTRGTVAQTNAVRSVQATSISGSVVITGDVISERK